MRKIYRERLCPGLIAVPYIFAVIKMTLVPMHVPVTGWQMLLFALGAFLFYCLIDTRPGWIIFFSAMLATAGYVVYTVIIGGLSSLSGTYAPFTKLLRVIIQIGTGYHDHTITETLLLLAVGVLAIVAALPIYLFMVHRFRFYPLIMPGLLLCMTVWGINRHIDKLSFYIFITIAIVCFIRHKYTSYGKRTGNSQESSSNTIIPIYFIPIALVIILIASGFKVNPLPVQWPWMDEKINTLYWDLHTKYAVDRYDKFTLASTGFGDPSRLGGPVRADNTPIMVVRAPARVYLRGAVYDQYTGTGWISSERLDADYLNDRLSDNQEIRYGWKALGLGYQIIDDEELEAYMNEGPQYSNDVGHGITTEEYLEYIQREEMPRILSRLHPEEKLIVRHLNVRTKSLFTPLKMFEPIIGPGREGYRIEENMDGLFFADKRLAKDTQYEYSYLQPAYGMRQMDNFYNMSVPRLYQQLSEYNRIRLDQLEQADIPNREVVKEKLESIIKLYALLERHRNEVVELYTQLPENIPQRIRNTALELTSFPGTTYEKVKALEDYLRSSFSYTLTPVFPPSDQDFVEYFLFDGQEGYCSYFASALCVLTRSIGVPARYVEGFVMPDEHDRNGYYHVTNQNAHAWVEVYLEGIGWVPFEPTPPYAGTMNYTVSLTQSTGEGAYPQQPLEMFDPYQENQDSQPVNLPLSDYGKDGISSVVILLCVLCGVLAVVLINRMVVLVRWILLKMIPAKRSVPILYRYLVHLLGQAGCTLRLGETPKDFAQRVDSRFQFAQLRMTEMVEHFYSVRFGAQPLDKKTLKQLFAFTREVRTKSGRTMYLMKRFLFRGILFRG